jgi:hypothetical protein
VNKFNTRSAVYRYLSKGIERERNPYLKLEYVENISELRFQDRRIEHTNQVECLAGNGHALTMGTRCHIGFKAFLIISYSHAYFAKNKPAKKSNEDVGSQLQSPCRSIHDTTVQGKHEALENQKIN